MPGTICLRLIKKSYSSMQMEVEQKFRYAVVAAVQLPSVSDMEFEASLTELRELAKTLGKEVIPQNEKGFIDKLKDLFTV